MADLKKLRTDYEDAETAFYALDNEYTEKKQALADKYRPRLDKLGLKAAEAQKTLADASAAQALADRDDLDDEGKQRLADTLGLTLPE